MRSLIYLFSCFIFFSFASNNKADQIIGTYWSPKKDGKIEIYKKAGKYNGKIAYSSSGKKDFKNPDKTKRDKSLQDLEILIGFEYSVADDEWINGTIYDPQNGKTYDCLMKLNKKNNLEVRGFIGFSMIGRTEIFERIK